MSNPQAEKLGLDNLARAQQMQINARLTALQAAQTLMTTNGYLKFDEKGAMLASSVEKVDIITLLAQASMIEEYILGDIVAKTEEAIAAVKLKLDPNRPRIVRP